MSGKETGNKPQTEYGRDAIVPDREHDSFFGKNKKYKNYTTELASEVKEALSTRGKVHWRVHNKIGNKINIDKQRRGLYEMICFNHECLTNILQTNGTISEEMLRSCDKLSGEIKKIANEIKPSPKHDLNDKLDNDNFVETFRKFHLSKIKSHRYLEEIEQIIKSKEDLTTKEEYLDKLLPYISTDLDFIEQYFALVKNNNNIEKKKYKLYAQKKLEAVDRKTFLGLEELGNTIRKLKPLTYREVFLKATGKGDHNIYNYLEDFEIFQEVYTDIFEALFEKKECNNLKKYLILSELLHIIKLVYEGLQEGSSLYREEKTRDKDDPLNRKLEGLLFQLDKHTRELSSINTTIDSSEIQEAIDFITDTATQYSAIMKRFIK